MADQTTNDTLAISVWEQIAVETFRAGDLVGPSFADRPSSPAAAAAAALPHLRRARKLLDRALAELIDNDPRRWVRWRPVRAVIWWRMQRGRYVQIFDEAMACAAVVAASGDLPPQVTTPLLYYRGFIRPLDRHTGDRRVLERIPNAAESATRPGI